MALVLSHREYGDGPPLVVLHGLFGSSRNWASIAQRLAPSWRVYTLDLRNHGESPWADEMSYHAMAADVLDFLDRQGLEAATVIGHSMGGKTAMMLALSHSVRVKALVVVDIAPVTYEHSFMSYVEAMQSLDLSGMNRRAEIDAQLRPSISDPGIRSFVLQNLVQREGSFAWRINLAALGAGMPTLSGFPNRAPEQVYSGSTLFLGGGLSDYIRPEHHALIYGMFPSAKFEDIPNAGHWVHAEAPESFLAHVRAFLGQMADGA